MTAVAIRLPDWDAKDDTGVRRRRPIGWSVGRSVSATTTTLPSAKTSGAGRLPLNEILGFLNGEFPQAPCEDVFDVLVRDQPAQVVAWIMSDQLSRADLAYAAEALGRELAGDSSAALLMVLLKLSEHVSPLVREGAIYGMADHWLGARVLEDRLRSLAAADPSPGVKEAAQEVLEDI